MSNAVPAPVAIVFYPEAEGPLPAIRAWQARNPAWRQAVPEPIVCPVCGIAARAIADLALLDATELRAALAQYRDVHLRTACSDHYWPTEEQWAVLESQSHLA